MPKPVTPCPVLPCVASTRLQTIAFLSDAGKAWYLSSVYAVFVCAVKASARVVGAVETKVDMMAASQCHKLSMIRNDRGSQVCDHTRWSLYLVCCVVCAALALKCVITRVGLFILF